MIQILSVDGHPLIHQGLQQLFQNQPDLQLKAQALNGQQAIQQLRNESFDLVLSEISLPDRDGIDIIRQMQSEYPDIHILVLSHFSETQYGVRAFKAGASGFINKQHATEKLLYAIHQVAAGKKYISDSIAEQLLHNITGKNPELLHNNLSNREYQTLCMIANGKSLSEMSEIMAISPKTVSVYRARMLEKMRFKNNADAIHYALAHQLIASKNKIKG